MTLAQFTQHFWLKTLISLAVFLSLTNCASQPPVTSFDGKWQFCDRNVNGEIMACLSEPDVQKLREILIRCEQK